jgi:hypothetical protein
MEKCTGTIFSLGTKTLAITTVFQYMRKTSALCCHCFPKQQFFLSFFLFFLQSLFAPLNGIQQLEDISDTCYQFFLTAFCALRAQFLCDTALLTWQFLFRHSSLNYREFKTKNWREQVPATSNHSILNPFKLLA